MLMFSYLNLTAIQLAATYSNFANENMLSFVNMPFYHVDRLYIDFNTQLFCEERTMLLRNSNSDKNKAKIRCVSFIYSFDMR